MLQAGEIMATRCISQLELDDLYAALADYREGRDPYAPKAMPSERLAVRTWWKIMSTAEGEPARKVAILQVAN